MAPYSETTEREYAVYNLDRQTTIAERVRLAGDSAARRKGLLGINKLATGAGLWIAPCEAIHTFGMRMPIDAVFLDATYRVRKLRANVAPWRIVVCCAAKSVLELQAGALKRSSTAAGDRLRFEEISGDGAGASGVGR